MTVLTQSQSTVIYATEVTTVTVTPSDGAQVSVSVHQPGGESSTACISQEQSYGPYIAGARIIVAAISGSATVSRNDSVGGGASSFTSLNDAPDAITPSGVCVGNDEGTALRMSDAITIGEIAGTVQITENGDGGVYISANGGGGFVASATGSGGLTLDAKNDIDDTGYVFIRSGDGGVDIVSNAAASPLTAIRTDGASGLLKLFSDGNNSVLLLQIGGTGSQLKIVGIPTSNPVVAGALWNDGGTLKISAG